MVVDQSTVIVEGSSPVARPCLSPHAAAGFRGVWPSRFEQKSLICGAPWQRATDECVLSTYLRENAGERYRLGASCRPKA